ncbi:MAG: hypothetical protein QXY53_03785 [Desulfurococcaceae archaeon]
MKKLLVAISIILCYIPAIPLPLIVSGKNPMIITIYMIIWVIYIPVILALMYRIEKTIVKKMGGMVLQNG